MFFSKPFILSKVKKQVYSNVSDTYKVIKWAAGADIDVSDIKRIDERKVLDLTFKHRIGELFYMRAMKERPPWFTQSLFLDLLTMRTTAQKRMRNNIEVGREIAAAVADRNPLVLFKGYSTYALTENNRHIKHSKDLDILYDDNEYLWDVLLKLGFTGKKKIQMRNVHEYGVAVRGDTILELHTHFPATSYSKSVRDSDLVPEHNYGTWLQPYSLIKLDDTLLLEHTFSNPDNTANYLQSNILYADIVQEGCYGIAPGTESIIFPNPAMGVLLHCVHMFRNHHNCHGWRKDGVGTVPKLCELVHIKDLSETNQFDIAKFALLIEKYHAHDAVRFVAYLLSAYFGVSPFSSLCEVGLKEYSTRDFPCLTTFLGTWTVIHRNCDDYLEPVSQREVIEEHLLTNRIETSTDKKSCIYDVQKKCGNKLIRNIIVQSAAGHSIPFSLSVNWQGDRISFELELVDAKLNDNFLICIISGEMKYESCNFWVEAGGNTCDFVGREDSASSVTCVSENYKIKISSKIGNIWQITPLEQRGKLLISVLLTVSKYSNSYESKESVVDPTVVVPLTIIQSSSV